MKKKTFDANISALRSMLSWILEEIRLLPFSPSSRIKIELACEEALINIIQHAYGQKNGIVELCLQEGKGQISIEIKDKGPPFNPLLKGEINPDLPLEKREEGGLGILIMKKNMDEIRYERNGDANVLILIKKY